MHVFPIVWNRLAPVTRFISGRAGGGGGLYRKYSVMPKEHEAPVNVVTVSGAPSCVISSSSSAQLVCVPSYLVKGKSMIYSLP
ncbi:hypothetical protein QQP08_004995 [Theobroma cacao]|nr:hypothetical protein QQP08_004995 [Theobroma cacao]